MLKEFLARHRRIGLDSSVFIFQVEENPKYVRLTHGIFEWLELPRNAGVTSTLTMLEVLVQPYRDSDDERIDAFYGLLATYPHLDWMDTSLEIADRAAQIRFEGDSISGRRTQYRRPRRSSEPRLALSLTIPCFEGCPTLT